MYYTEVTKAIIKHEIENFETEFSISDIKELYKLVEDRVYYNAHSYIEPECKTKYTYVAIHKERIDDIWRDGLIDLFDECYLHDIPEHIRKYIDYDSWVEDCMNDGRPHHFNGYDGYTEIETDNYYIYYHNRNY